MEEAESPEPARKDRPRKKPPFDLSFDRMSKFFHIESRESRAELISRLREQERQKDDERREEFLVLVTALSGLVAIGGCCLFVAFRPGHSEDKKWAMAVLASIVSFGIGHASRGSLKPE